MTPRDLKPGTRITIALPEGLCLGTIVENVPSHGGYLVQVDGTGTSGGFGYNEVQFPAFDQGDRVRIMLPALGDLQVRTGVVIGPPRPNGYLVRLDQDHTSATLSRTCLDACPDKPWYERLDWL